MTRHRPEGWVIQGLSHGRDSKTTWHVQKGTGKVGMRCGHWPQHENASAHRCPVGWGAHHRNQGIPRPHSPRPGPLPASALLTRVMSTILGTQGSSSPSSWVTTWALEGVNPRREKYKRPAQTEADPPTTCTGSLCRHSKKMETEY